VIMALQSGSGYTLSKTKQATVAILNGP
jgi:hypothetical protein